MRMHTIIYIHTYTHTHTHQKQYKSYNNTYTYTQTHTHTHTHTHKHTHVHRRAPTHHCFQKKKLFSISRGARDFSWDFRASSCSCSLLIPRCCWHTFSKVSAYSRFPIERHHSADFSESVENLACARSSVPRRRGRHFC